jgi:hypothetical protein
MIGSEHLRIAGRLGGDGVDAVEAANMDRDASARVVLDDDGRFELELEGAPPDRLRLWKPSQCWCEPNDYALTEEGASPVRNQYDCFGISALAGCCLTRDAGSCTIGFTLENRCTQPLVVTAVAPRTDGEGITVTTELPLEIVRGEPEVLNFAMNGMISELLFFEIAGAEEAMIAVTLQSEP